MGETGILLFKERLERPTGAAKHARPAAALTPERFILTGGTFM
jgi:hypothetical protein